MDTSEDTAGSGSNHGRPKKTREGCRLPTGCWFPYPGICDDIGCPQLINAAWEGKVDEVRSLLDGGAEVNQTWVLRSGKSGKYEETNGATALLKAVRGGHVDVVRLLLERGADANQAQNNGVTRCS